MSGARPVRRLNAPFPPAVSYALRRRVRQAAREEKMMGKIIAIEGLRLPGNTNRTDVSYNLRGRILEMLADTKNVWKTTLYMDLALRGEASTFEICELFRDEAEHYGTLANEQRNIEDLILAVYRERPQRWEMKRKGSIKVVQQYSPPGTVPPKIKVPYFKSFLDEIPSSREMIAAANGDKEYQHVNTEGAEVGVEIAMEE